jgi:integrase
MPKRERKALTNIRINAFEPKIKDYEVFDRNVGGLSIRIFPSGQKSFSINFRINGKRKRMRIGNYKDMSIVEARQIAIELKERVKGGVYPINKSHNSIAKEEEEKVKETEDQTIAKLSAEFIKKYCIGEGSEPNLKSWLEYQRILNKYVIPHWGKLHIEVISIGALTTLLDTISKQNGPVMANRVLAVTRKLFNWARDRGVIDYVPIVPNIARKEKARTRFLNDEEIIEFWKGCEKESYPFGKLFQLLLLTGQRLSEVTNMRWSQLDMNYKGSDQLYKVWKLPSHSTKFDRIHVIPLSSMAVELINSIPRFMDNDLLFPSSGSNDGPVSGFGKPKKRICTFEADWRLNDLRRTFWKNFSRLEIDYMICNEVLGHTDQKIEGYYDHRNYLKQKQSAMNKWAQLLLSILSKNTATLEKG